MEATCKNCNHWEQEEAKENNLGACDVLGSQSEMTLVLPVVNSEEKATGILTNADFGCNQFDGE